jgi:hypothetical protein
MRNTEKVCRGIPARADGRSQQEPTVDPDTLFDSLLRGRVRTVGKLVEPTAD